MGAAAAMSIVMMVVIVMLTLTQMRLVRDEDTSFD
jgi:ABC-type sugar transport system permease subunit